MSKPKPLNTVSIVLLNEYCVLTTIKKMARPGTNDIHGASW